MYMCPNCDFVHQQFETVFTNLHEQSKNDYVYRCCGVGTKQHGGPVELLRLASTEWQKDDSHSSDEDASDDEDALHASMTNRATRSVARLLHENMKYDRTCGNCGAWNCGETVLCCKCKTHVCVKECLYSHPRKNRGAVCHACMDNK
jgi:hypothetical protein